MCHLCKSWKQTCHCLQKLSKITNGIFLREPKTVGYNKLPLTCPNVFLQAYLLRFKKKRIKRFSCAHLEPHIMSYKLQSHKHNGVDLTFLLVKKEQKNHLFLTSLCQACLQMKHCCNQHTHKNEFLPYRP